VLCPTLRVTLVPYTTLFRSEVLKAFSGMWNERAWRLRYVGGAIRSDHRQHPRVHRLMAEAAASLDIETLPELYVVAGPMINAERSEEHTSELQSRGHLVCRL